ncbi:MAG TPA: UDP-glucose--hexose-1-phosphate uridylyltransferase [Pseudomonadales bacterium]|nr:UDP-glucose--hexose-1-phosphate uridylyltransferase [Pseudomonadales bacterium]
MSDAVHRRFDPLTEEWVLVSPHRGRRPWQGQEDSVTVAGARHDPDCHLCPGNLRANGVRNPVYDDVHLFDNDFPALLDASPAQASVSPLLRAEPVRGRCRVLCFSPHHDLSLARMDDAARGRVVQAWMRETRDLGRDWRWVQCFENKGAMMGCSSPHPHGQIWALDALPTLAATELRTQQAHHDASGRALLLDVLDAEVAAGERIVVENEEWVVLVPFWARWPFETLLLPRRPCATLDGLSDAAAAALPPILGALLRAYDNLFRCDFPYSFGWHGAPTQADARVRAAWQLHAHLYPPLLRSATVRKFMVGFEMLAEAQRDLTPEAAAARLRAVLGPHWQET